jgi:23S rRNA pseudouridine1911/1915/1917 synthase
VKAKRHEFLIEADENVRLDLLVAARADLSRTQAATLIANGNVTVNGARERASYRPVVGDRITVDEPIIEERPILAESIPVRVVFEDEYMLVVDKSAGMVVHPAPGNWSGTLVNALMGRGGELSPGSSPDRAGIVHRLDRKRRAS